MDIAAMLGIDLTDPIQQNAIALAESDERLLDDLVALREAQGLSQTEIADRLGVGQSAISRIESGERDPHLSTLRRYALALGARIDHRVTAFNPAVFPSEDEWALATVERVAGRPVTEGAARGGLAANTLAAAAWGSHQ